MAKINRTSLRDDRGIAHKNRNNTLLTREAALFEWQCEWMRREKKKIHRVRLVGYTPNTNVQQLDTAARRERLEGRVRLARAAATNVLLLGSSAESPPPAPLHFSACRPATTAPSWRRPSCAVVADCCSQQNVQRLTFLLRRSASWRSSMQTLLQFTYLFKVFAVCLFCSEYCSNHNHRAQPFSLICNCNTFFLQ